MRRPRSPLGVVLLCVAGFGVLSSTPAQAQRLNPALADDFLRLLSEMRPAIAATGDDTARAVARALDDPAIASEVRRIAAAAATAPRGTSAGLLAKLSSVAADHQYVTSARGRAVLLSAANDLDDNIIASPRLSVMLVLLRILKMEPDAAIDYAAGAATLNDSVVPFLRTKISVRASLTAAGLIGTGAICQTFDCLQRRDR